MRGTTPEEWGADFYSQCKPEIDAISAAFPVQTGVFRKPSREFSCPEDLPARPGASPSPPRRGVRQTAARHVRAVFLSAAPKPHRPHAPLPTPLAKRLPPRRSESRQRKRIQEPIPDFSSHKRMQLLFKRTASCAFSESREWLPCRYVVPTECRRKGRGFPKAKRPSRESRAAK